MRKKSYWLDWTLIHENMKLMSIPVYDLQYTWVLEKWLAIDIERDNSVLHKWKTIYSLFIHLCSNDNTAY